MEDEHHDFDDTDRKGAFKYIIGAFLILLIVLMVFPQYSVKLDPEPKNIPNIQSVIPDLKFEKHNITVNTKKDFLKFIDAKDPEVKLTADRIVSQSCDSGRICHAKALFYFVRDNFDYVSDPARYEYVKTAEESLLSQGGDCDDASVLLANLLQSIGINTRFVFVPGHVFIQANLPEALNRYKTDGDWVNLDATCTNCDFGELSYSTSMKEKTYVP